MTEYNIRLNPNCAAAVHTGLKFKAGDKGITFRIAVDELDTTGTTAKIVFLRANGTSVESDISGTDGVYIYKTLGNEFAVPGKTVADVKFYASGNRESTASFVFEVCGDTMNGLGAGTGGYSDRLEQLVSEAEAAGELTEQAKAELEAAENDMKTTEAEMAAVIQNFKNQYGEVGALNPRGNWNSSVSYGIRDVVFYMGYSWICLAQNTGNAPVDGSDYWMKNADLDYSNPNLLINSDFRNPVNTNGLTSYGGYRWTIDKWFVNYDTSVTVNDGYITIGGDNNLRQTFDEPLPNGIYTATFRAKSSDGCMCYLEAQDTINVASLGSVTVTLTSEWEEYTFTFTGEPNMIWTGITGPSRGQGLSYDVEWIKLEKGSVATPFIPPNKEVEKLKCGATGFVKGMGEYFASGETILSWALNPNGVYHKSFAGGVVPSDAPFDGEGHVELLLVNSRYTVRCTRYLGSEVFLRNIFGSAWYNNWHQPKAGDADTVDGYHANQLAKTGTAYGTSIFSYYTDFGGKDTDTLDELIDKMPNYSMLKCVISCHIVATGIGAPSDLYEYVEFEIYKNDNLHAYAKLTDNITNKEYYNGRADALTCNMGGWHTKFFPITGGKITASYIPLQIDNATVGATSVGIGFLLGGVEVGNLGFDNNKPIYYDTATATAHDILHTGNSHKVLSGGVAPTDTSGTTIWIDTVNKVIKKYVDGAWTIVV